MQRKANANRKGIIEEKILSLYLQNLFLIKELINSK
jgi:hypothetical protein